MVQRLSLSHLPPLSPLPIDALLDELKSCLGRRDEAVLEAMPGAGKTTRVPLALLDSPWLAGRRILLLEPRRLAARAVAERLAEQFGERPGGRVGYRMRLDSRIGPDTRLEVVTVGVLLHRLQRDPALEDVGLVIFDEFHERHLDADLGLALCLAGRELLREPSDPLKLLVMSATLDGERIAGLLGDAPRLSSQGRLYPVAMRYAATPLRLDDWPGLEARLVETIDAALIEQSGDLLVFLPGKAEIRRLATRLEGRWPGPDAPRVLPLHGELPLERQRAAIAPDPQGRRRIVLASSIAETSLTVEGVRVVIDAGLSRAPRFDPSRALTRLETRRVSKAQADQRAGRAGRLAPGVCHRLWSESQQATLAAYAGAEILEADLGAMLLQALRFGAEPEELRWLDPPPVAALAQARGLLRTLGALDDDGRLTAHGEAMAGLPLPPRLGHMLLRARELGQGALGCELAALLEERGAGAGPDLAARVGAVGAAQRQARRYCRLLGIEEQAVESPVWSGALLAFAFPDRIARQRSPGGVDYLLANGRAAHFQMLDPLCRSQWLVIAELGGRQGEPSEVIRQAVELDPSLFEGCLAPLLEVRERCEWPARSEAMLIERQWRAGELVVKRAALESPAPSLLLDAQLGFIRARGLELLPWTPALMQLRARVALLRRIELENDGESRWPALDDDALLAGLDQWLAPWLQDIRRVAHFERLPLEQALLAQLPWPLPAELERLAPTHLPLPSGSRARLDYDPEGVAPPVLAARLQELFGATVTPSVADGRQPVVLHLLSPARRPVQVTGDLASFWRSGYPEVKKELKGRYPKHFWPDDPLKAEPTARTKPR
ncbi:ATP-dependent helicase HrpB [Halotalea alkalilenta]|uniref:ATP-dependent helicase HrpB n=1 Tax=Halotalea alkalilenta TaxID=376489 RepID=UPI0006940BE3|nr:ATP-dependent helicase HrpB [Halotalea alkalilenta]